MRHLLPLTALALLSGPAAAEVESCHSASTGLTATSWSQSFTFPRFDPRLGTLRKVHLRAELTSESTLRMENPSGAPVNASVQVDNLFTLTLPGGATALTASSSVSRSGALAAFDGATDFDGPSGATFEGVGDVVNGYATLTAPADLSLFTGAGNVSLGGMADAACSSTCACSLVHTCTNSSSVTITVCYGYDPAPTVRHEFSVPLQPTGWSEQFSLPAFDPAVGRLAAVVVEGCVRTAGSIGVENIDSIPASANIDYTVDVSALLSTMSLFSSQPSLSFSENYSAFDGAVDFNGPSGSFRTVDFEDPVRLLLTLPGDLDLFEGTAPIPLTLTGVTQCTVFGPAGLATSCIGAASLDLAVSYVFVPCSSTSSTQVRPLQPANWTDTVVVPQFDTSVGELRGVLVMARAELESDIAYESTDVAPTDLVLAVEDRLDLRRPDSSLLLQTAPRVSADEHAEEGDGVLDFAGPSGSSLVGLRSCTLASTLLTSPADLALFSGTGNVLLPLEFNANNATVQGTPNVTLQAQSRTGAWVRVVYVYAPPIGTASCFGVGCPCANDDPAAGCANSTGSGALLAAVGTGSVSCDDLVLRATGLPASQTGLFYMGDAQVQGFFFDGFQCALGNTRRFLDSAQSSGAAGAVAYTGVVEASSGDIVSGSTWHFHFWHRDTAGSPCGTGANLTNLLSITFAP